MGTSTIRLTFLLLIILLSAGETFAQTEPDTLINIEKKSKLVITETRSGVTIKVTGNDNGEPFMSEVTTNFGLTSQVNTRQNTLSQRVGKLFSKDLDPSSSPSFNTDRLVKFGSWSLFLNGVCLGLTNSSGQGNPGGLQWSKSIEICWMNAFGLKYQFTPDLSMSFGLGFDWKNYKTTLCNQFINVTEKGELEWAFTGDDRIIRMSRLKTFAVQFPLLINSRIRNTSTNVKFGPILNVNTYSSVKTKYYDEVGSKKTDFRKGLDMKKATFDLFGAISYGNCFGVYVRYSPIKIMNGGDLNFSPLTLGFTIGI